MKAQFFLPMSLLVSVALVGLMKIRKREEEKVDRQWRFEDIKLRVTHDVLTDYQKENVVTHELVDKTESELKKLEGEFNEAQGKAQKATGEADICRGAKKTSADELAAVETELNNLKASTDQETSNWKTEVETLQQKLAKRSSVCDFVKKESSADASKYCGEVKAEEPKPEEPKPEAPKPEEPKPEEPKPEAPKPEEPKPEAPKPEEPKPEAPKPEEPKPEAPKPEEPKPEAPKPEEAKPEEPKAEALKPEEPKVEAEKKT